MTQATARRAQAVEEPDQPLLKWTLVAEEEERGVLPGEPHGGATAMDVDLAPRRVQGPARTAMDTSRKHGQHRENRRREREAATQPMGGGSDGMDHDGGAAAAAAATSMPSASGAGRMETEAGGSDDDDFDDGGRHDGHGEDGPKKKRMRRGKKKGTGAINKH